MADVTEVQQVVMRNADDDIIAELSLYSRQDATVYGALTINGNTEYMEVPESMAEQLPMYLAMLKKQIGG